MWTRLAFCLRGVTWSPLQSSYILHAYAGSFFIIILFFLGEWKGRGAERVQCLLTLCLLKGNIVTFLHHTLMALVAHTASETEPQRQEVKLTSSSPASWRSCAAIPHEGRRCGSIRWDQTNDHIQELPARCTVLTLRSAHSFRNERVWTNQSCFSKHHFKGPPFFSLLFLLILTTSDDKKKKKNHSKHLDHMSGPFALTFLFF